MNHKIFIRAGISSILVVAIIGLKAWGGISFGPIQAVKNKINEYNEKTREEGIRAGSWRSEGGEISGTIENTLGQKVNRMYVFLNTTYIAYMYQTSEFAIPNLPQGTSFTVRASYDYQGNSFAVMTQCVTVQGQTIIKIVFPALIVTVKDSAGNPLDSCQISVDGVTYSGSGASLSTDSSGRCIVPAIGPGIHTIRAKKSDQRIVESTVTVVTGQTATLDLTLESIVLGSNLSGSYNDGYRLSTANSPYTVTGNVNFTSLLIDPGVVVKFGGSYSFYADAVKAAGTASNPIRFTSGRSSPASGDYSTVYFGNDYYGSKVVLDYVTFEYGSHQYLCLSSSSTVTNCTFKNTNSLWPMLNTLGSVEHCTFEKTGPSLQINGTPKISYCNIVDQISVQGSAGQYSINYCNLTKGAGTVLSNGANWAIDATNNWWGTTNAATIAGYISCSAGSVTSSPFLGSAVTTAGPQ